VECLRDLADFVGKMNAARKANKALSEKDPNQVGGRNDR
jgi:hypothetical protein